MSIHNINIDEFKGFSKRLAILARNPKYNYGKTEDLVEALYNNKECLEIIKPRERKNKDGKIVKSASKEKEAIKRAIQHHYEEADPCKIPSTYMYAYSILFDCSLDYLYGKTQTISTNLEVKDICTKTGLTEEATKALIESRNRNERLDDSLSYSEWWSILLQKDSFRDIPRNWYAYADLMTQIKSITKAPKQKTSPDTLLAQVKDAIPISFLKKYMTEDELLEGITESLADEGDTIRECQEKEEAKQGAFFKLLSNIQNVLTDYAEEWSDEQYPDYEKRQLQSDLDSIKNFFKGKKM